MKKYTFRYHSDNWVDITVKAEDEEAARKLADDRYNNGEYDASDTDFENTYCDLVETVFLTSRTTGKWNERRWFKILKFILAHFGCCCHFDHRSYDLQDDIPSLKLKKEGKVNIEAIFLLNRGDVRIAYAVPDRVKFVKVNSSNAEGWEKLAFDVYYEFAQPESPELEDFIEQNKL